MRLRPHISVFIITLLIGWALNSAAQVQPTPTPTAAPRLVVGAGLAQVSGHSVIACTVKDSSGHAVPSKTVSVQKAAAMSGPFALWMSKKTNVNGQATFPYAPPTYTWYVRCASMAGAAARAQSTLYVSATKRIVGKKWRPSPTATPQPTATAKPTVTATPTATPIPTVTPTATPRPTVTPIPTATPIPAPTTPSTTVAPSFFGMHYSSAIYQPWPTVSFSTLRLWDQWPLITWMSINPSRGTYDWTLIDQVVNTAVSHGVDIVYTFGYVPAFASTNPTYAPNLSDWTAFVTAITSRYKGKIKYWELWNEPNASNFWQGTTEQLVAMAQAAYPVIKNAGGVVLSPAPQGAAAYQWLDGYFAAGGAAYADIVSFHGYLFGAPEGIVTLAANVKAVAAKYGLSDKPVWDTEHSWGVPSWPFGADQDQQAAWLARYLTLSFSSGIERSFWYMWDGFDTQEHWGMLYEINHQQLQKPGIAYGQVYSWLVGASMDPCTLSGGIYQCRLTRAGGYEGLIVWAADSNPSFTAPYTVPARYARYRTLDGTITTLGGSTLRLTMKPILLEY